jgi:hypothetical protein
MNEWPWEEGRKDGREGGREKVLKEPGEGVFGNFVSCPLLLGCLFLTLILILSN